MDDEPTQPIPPFGPGAEPPRARAPEDAPVPPPPPLPPGSSVPPPPPGPGQAAPLSEYAGGPPPARRYPAPIGWVIAAIILFWPTAIPALLASHRASSAGGAGDVVTADREAATAKRWSIVSVCVGGAIILLSIVFSIVWVVLVATAFHANDRGGFFFEQRPGPGHHLQINPPGGSKANPRGTMPYGPRGGMKVTPTPSPSPTTTP